MILLKYILDLPINHDLKNYVCYELLEDNDGRLWIGTNNGIYIYDKQKQTLQHIGKRKVCLVMLSVDWKRCARKYLVQYLQRYMSY